MLMHGIERPTPADTLQGVVGGASLNKRATPKRPTAYLQLLNLRHEGSQIIRTGQENGYDDILPCTPAAVGCLRAAAPPAALPAAMSALKLAAMSVWLFSVSASLNHNEVQQEMNNQQRPKAHLQLLNLRHVTTHDIDLLGIEYDDNLPCRTPAAVGCPGAAAPPWRCRRRCPR